MDVTFITTTAAKLNSIPIVDGQVIAISDESSYYYDMSNKRNRVSGTAFVSNLVGTGQENMLYVVSDPAGLYLYENGEYKSILPDAGIPDAPSDGKLYGRQDGEWAVVDIPDSNIPSLPTTREDYNNMYQITRSTTNAPAWHKSLTVYVDNNTFSLNNLLATSLGLNVVANVKIVGQFDLKGNPIQVGRNNGRGLGYQMILDFTDCEISNSGTSCSLFDIQATDNNELSSLIIKGLNMVPASSYTISNIFTAPEYNTMHITLEDCVFCRKSIVNTTSSIVSTCPITFKDCEFCIDGSSTSDAIVVNSPYMAGQCIVKFINTSFKSNLDSNSKYSIFLNTQGVTAASFICCNILKSIYDIQLTDVKTKIDETNTNSQLT